MIAERCPWCHHPLEDNEHKYQQGSHVESVQTEGLWEIRGVCGFCIWCNSLLPAVVLEAKA